MSSLSWLDTAEADRQRALDVIDLFRELDTRDELGVGTVRDAFSDLLFPGTGAIQTRARYFLIIPWIYLRHEKRRTPSAEIAERSRLDELRLIDVLDDSDDPHGTIGVRARRRLKRLPSMVYWRGLGVLGIREFPGSRDQYHRSLDRFYQRKSFTVRNDDDELVTAGRVRNWHVALPPAPDDFPNVCSLALRRIEAEYLRERIMHAAPLSLLAYLIDRGAPAPDAPFAWHHPGSTDFPEVVVRDLEHARNFSELIHGAALLYNLMLAQKRGDAKLAGAYLDEMTEWSSLCEARSSEHRRWDREAFWQLVNATGARVAAPTRAFIDAWITLALRDDRRALSADASARKLIFERERKLKGNLARLDGGRPLEMWGGAAGTGRLDYRWSAIARQLVEDVHTGLEEADARTA
jgi:hypothetical protein